jgi:hypothetical protein
MEKAKTANRYSTEVRSPSTYHAHAAKRADADKRSARERRDAALQADIRRVWDANFQVYGVPGGSSSARPSKHRAAKWRG